MADERVERVPKYPWTISDLRLARALLARRHPDYRELYYTCCWIVDTLESGRQYKHASYDDQWPFGEVQNLARHRRELPLPGQEGPTSEAEWFWGLSPSADVNVMTTVEYNRAAEENYQVRLMRTPTPTKLRQVTDAILSKIYSAGPRREVKADLGADGTAPPAPTPLAKLEAWWSDVDGKGTEIGHWMKEEVAPLLLCLGMIDIYCDHPSRLTQEVVMEESAQYGDIADATAYAESNRRVDSEEDVLVQALDGCVAQYILPHHVEWYRLDNTGREYVEILLTEWHVHTSTEHGTERYVRRHRYWNTRGWTLYDDMGHWLDEGEHRYGRVPIERCFDRRHVRIAHAGDSRMLGIVEKSREAYNEESELIYAMDLQCFAFLQAPPMPSDRRQGAIPIGPGMTVFKVPTPDGTAFEGYEYISPQVTPLDFVRQRLMDLDDLMDREAGLSRPAGAMADSGKHVAASGISKAFDQEEGNNLLASVSASLEAAERKILLLATTVLNDRRPTPEEARQVQVIYPKRFNLLRFDDFAKMVPIYILFRDQCGHLPSLERVVLRSMAEELSPAVGQEVREEQGREIDAYVAWKLARVKEAAAAGPLPGERTVGGAASGSPTSPTGGTNGVPALAKVPS